MIEQDIKDLEGLEKRLYYITHARDIPPRVESNEVALTCKRGKELLYLMYECREELKEKIKEICQDEIEDLRKEIENLRKII